MAHALRIPAGMTLIELVAALAIGALVLAGLRSVVSLGVRAQAEGGQSNELLYQGQFALRRMVDKARNTAPKVLATPAAGTTDTWFAPAKFCRNASSELIETTTTDANCTNCNVCTIDNPGASVIATNVTTFTAAVPLQSASGPVDKPVAVLSLTLAHSAAAQAVTLTTSVRLGGGTL